MFHPGFTDKEACRNHDNSFPSFMKRDVDILKRFTQMSCCLLHDLFQGISESLIMSVTLTSARRCAPLSCSLETSDTLTTSSILPGLEDLKCMIVDMPQVDRFLFPDVHRVIVLLQADHLQQCRDTTTAFIGGFRLLQKQLDEQVAKLHIRALREREFMAIDSAHLKALDFKRNYGPAFLSVRQEV